MKWTFSRLWPQISSKLRQKPIISHLKVMICIFILAIEKIINLLEKHYILTLTNFPAHNLEDINLHPLPEENQFLLQTNVVAIIILIINTTTTIMEMVTPLYTDTITMSSICQLLYGQNQQVK